MSPGPVPIPPAARPTNRNEADSDAMKVSVPVLEICCSDTALASGHPSHPPVFLSPPLVDDMLIRLIQLTDPVGEGPGAGAGAGVGAGVGGAGVGEGAGDGDGAGGVGAGVGEGLGAGAPPETPSFCCGIRTMNASLRLVPRLVVQMKYSPVGSRLPLGRFE